MRERDKILCPDEEGFDDPSCERLTDVSERGLADIYPPAAYTANVFQVTAEASYGDVRRTIEAIIDRSEATTPLILSWRVR